MEISSAPWRGNRFMFSNARNKYHRRSMFRFSVYLAYLIMVARSSDSESKATIIFYGCFFFFICYFSSRHTFSDVAVGKPTSRNFPTQRGLVFNRTFAIAISSKCPLKRTGAEKNEICTIFHAKSQTVSAV